MVMIDDRRMDCVSLHSSYETMELIGKRCQKKDE